MHHWNIWASIIINSFHLRSWLWPSAIHLNSTRKSNGYILSREKTWCLEDRVLVGTGIFPPVIWFCLGGRGGCTLWKSMQCNDWYSKLARNSPQKMIIIHLNLSLKTIVSNDKSHNSPNQWNMNWSIGVQASSQEKNTLPCCAIFPKISDLWKLHEGSVVKDKGQTCLQLLICDKFWSIHHCSTL